MGISVLHSNFYVKENLRPEQIQISCTQRPSCGTGFFVKKNPTCQVLDRIHHSEPAARARVYLARGLRAHGLGLHLCAERKPRNRLAWSRSGKGAWDALAAQSFFSLAQSQIVYQICMWYDSSTLGHRLTPSHLPSPFPGDPNANHIQRTCPSLGGLRYRCP
jgi:hypothetical protein